MKSPRLSGGYIYKGEEKRRTKYEAYIDRRGIIRTRKIKRGVK